MQLIKLKQIIRIFLFIFLIFSFNQSLADTTTVTYAGTATDGGGSFPWSNPSNATGNTTSTFSSNSPDRNNSTNQIILTNFNLTSAGIPSDSLIDGIQVEVERDVNGDRTRDTTVQLTKNGTTGIGNNYANNSDGPTTKSTTIYGGPTDLWGTSWTTSELISNNFGVILDYDTSRNNRTINVYRVMITVDYTPLTESMTGNILDFETTGGYTVTEGTWTRTTNNPYEGSYSLESGNHTDNTTSCFQVTKDVTSDTTLTFYKTVSSEATYDFLRFYIDGVQQDEWSGEVAWSQESYPLTTGFYTFEWCYEKDFSVSNGSDTAWVDLIEVQNDTINIINQVFHFDAFDIDGDGDTTDNPSEGSDVTSWNDLFNSNDATGTNAPTFDSESIKTHTGVVFSGSDYLNIGNDTAINTSTYDQKSFAIIFKTGDDINTLQNIYEQGGGARGYAIQIENGQLYAGVWNNVEWQNGDQYKVLSTNIQQNTEYILIMVHDATDTSLSNRTFQVYLNGTSLGTLINVDVQGGHSGNIEIGRSGGAIQLSNSTGLGVGSNFTGNIGEFFSWNQALTSTEINDIYDYLYDKWLSAEFPIAPGGVDSGLQIWLKANKGTSTTTDGASLISWFDQSGNGYDLGGGVSPTYLNNTTNGNLNYNPIVNFDGTQYLDNFDNGASSVSYYMVIVPNTQVDGTLIGQTPFGMDCNSGILSSGTCGLPFAGPVLGAFTIAINDEVVTHALGSSDNWRSAQIGAYSYQSGKPILIGFNENFTTDSTDIYEKSDKIDNFTVNTYQTLTNADYRLGRSMDGANIFPYDGKIAEIIDFSGKLSDLERKKIESYLAIKYGITLKDGTEDYIASDGITTFWDSASAGNYVNDIFGIFRDDLSELSQIKSKSENLDGVLTVNAIGEGSNISPSFVDISDKESLLISNNDEGNTWSGDNNPSGYYLFSRVWQVQELGEVGTISLDFDVDNTYFDIPDLSSGINYFFVYDSDNDNLLSDETPISMTNTIGSIWQVSGIDLDNLMEFTIATQDTPNNIPTDINISNNYIDENVSIGTVIGNFSTIDPDIGDTHTYNLIVGTGDDDNSMFTIVGDTISINQSPDYEVKQTYNIRVQVEDGNGGQFQKQFNIFINDLWETTTTILDFEQPGKYSVTSGDWTRTITNPYESSYSIESDNLGIGNTQSCFEVSHTSPYIGTIDFFYSVSSELNGDYLRFYIDDIEQQAWSGNVPWNQYTQNNISSGTHIYKWCYLKNGTIDNGTDNAFVDYITFQTSVLDPIPPVISSINFSSGSLLPGGNHNLIINYSDTESGINITSDVIELYKWDGVSSWGSDISSSGLNLGSKTVTSTTATYSTNNLSYGKYRYNFQIFDNNLNPSSTSAIFYIDEPELIISSGSFNLGTLSGTGLKLSDDEINIEVKTVGAEYQIEFSKDSDFESSGGAIIIDWDGNEGVGYDINPYLGTNKNINSNQIIGTGAQNININGFKNSYNYNIKIGNLLNLGQAAGEYYMNISFRSIFGY